MATSFADLGVSAPLVDVLRAQGISEPFAIQAATIEAGLAGRDICGKAPTGSGKTLAFGIPAIELGTAGTPWRPSVLILSPTRELASQIAEDLEPLAAAKDRSVLTVYGGTNIERDIKRLERGVDILVACPGRLEDLIARRCCELRNVELVVVDEADRMADMGFLPSVKRILDQTPGNRQTLLFSATLDGDVDTLVKRYQDDPLRFEVVEQADDTGDVEHTWYLIQPVDRVSSAVEVLKRFSSSIVFCRTRKGCDRVAKNLAKRGLSTVAIHGDLSQHQRERALADFTGGRAQVMVATDVAARGIHVDEVSLVMHYDPAGSDKDYIHRSGRTGRAGQDGRVISMVVEDKKKLARQLQIDLGMKPGFDPLDLDALGPVVEVRGPAAQPASPSESGNRGDGGRRRGRGRDERDGGGRGRGDRERSGRGGRGRSGRSGSGDDDGRRDRQDRQDRSERRPDGKPKRTRRRGGKDWYPPGYHDDEDKRSGRSERTGTKPGGSRSGGSGGDGAKKDDSSPGGRGSKQRRPRSVKGRHADEKTKKNKGKRRNPRRR